MFALDLDPPEPIAFEEIVDIQFLLVILLQEYVRWFEGKDTLTPRGFFAGNKQTESRYSHRN